MNTETMCWICSKEGSDWTVELLYPQARPILVHKQCLEDALSKVVWRGGYGKEVEAQSENTL